jgi:CheY-like chemotaxis protein
VCSSGAEAVAKAAAFAPDLVVLDVMMPGMDGPGTLAALRALPALARTPVVFMTAKVQPAEIAHFRSLGALEVIAKPFDPMRLADTIREIWRRHG